MSEQENNQKETQVGDSYGNFKLGAIYEQQRQEINNIRTLLTEAQENRNKDIEVLKTSIVEELKKQSERTALTPEEAESEFSKEMEWIKQNEGTEEVRNYLEDPINFACWYCHSRGLVSSLKDWKLLRETTLKDIKHWQDIFSAFDLGHTPMSNKTRLIKEEDLIIE